MCTNIVKNFASNTLYHEIPQYCPEEEDKIHEISMILKNSRKNLPCFQTLKLCHERMTILNNLFCLLVFGGGALAVLSVALRNLVKQGSIEMAALSRNLTSAMETRDFFMKDYNGVVDHWNSLLRGIENCYSVFSRNGNSKEGKSNFFKFVGDCIEYTSPFQVPKEPNRYFDTYYPVERDMFMPCTPMIYKNSPNGSFCHNETMVNLSTKALDCYYKNRESDYNVSLIRQNFQNQNADQKAAYEKNVSDLQAQFDEYQYKHNLSKYSLIALMAALLPAGALYFLYLWYNRTISFDEWKNKPHSLEDCNLELEEKKRVEQVLSELEISFEDMSVEELIENLETMQEG